MILQDYKSNVVYYIKRTKDVLKNQIIGKNKKSNPNPNPNPNRVGTYTLRVTNAVDADCVLCV